MMPPKARYPRRKGLREKMPLHRIVLLLVVLGAAPALFFFSGPERQADRGQESAERHKNQQQTDNPSDDQGLEALDRLAASISLQREGQARSALPQAGNAAAQTSGQAGAQAAASSGDQAAGQVTDLPSEPAPFAGKSLDQTALELARRYAGRQPLLWGERLPGISSSLSPGPPGDGAALSGARPASTAPAVVALTLDACAGKKGESFDKGIIDYLRAEKIPATIFVTGLWLKNNAEILRDLAADPLFEIAAHGAAHKPASVNGRVVYGIAGTASIAELVREVEGNARAIEALTGKRPRWYRAGTAYYDDVAVSVISDLGLKIAGYSIAGDEGATLAPGKVKAKVAVAGPGDILLLHLNKPRSGSREGLLAALPLLKENGLRFVRLSDKLPEPDAVK